MANTPFLDLVKPAGTDKALVSVLNSNSDKIDGGVSTLSEQIGALNNRFTLLAANVDLNTVKTSGLYGTRANNSHVPVANVGQLIVIQYSNDWVTQIWASGATNARGTLFVRNYYDGSTWTDWQRLAIVEVDRSVANGATKTISMLGDSALLYLKRNDSSGLSLLLGFEYLVAGYTVVAGTENANVTVSKSANSKSISITNNTGRVLFYNIME